MCEADFPHTAAPKAASPLLEPPINHNNHCRMYSKCYQAYGRRTESISKDPVLSHPHIDKPDAYRGVDRVR